jgi:predicted small integral membrane protein
MSGGPSLSFVLLSEARYPDAGALVQAAAALGETLTPGEVSDEGVMVFHTADGKTLMVMLVEAAHPDAAHMPMGLASTNITMRVLPSAV